jgi:serine/threonine protein kinase/tetratricopeptide (TPR) repeat protein
LDVAVCERDTFLRRECEGDESLETEIKSLLSSHREAENFLETPAAAEAARAFLFEDQPQLRASRSPSAGQSISHYRILERLGAGGMGVVHKAEDTRLHRFVALKFLPETLAGQPRALEQLRREAQSASALNHPHICTVHDIAEENEQVFIVMEHLEGETLRQRIKGRPLPIGQVVHVALQIVDALEAAHEKGIIHRDIKPANIFVTLRGDVKVLDFGLAKLTEAGAGSINIRATDSITDETFKDGNVIRLAAGKHLTRSSIAMGTIAYMAPEQARGELPDARADLFSFGAVLYEMATGQMAFGESTNFTILQAMVDYEPIPPSQLNPTLPAGLIRVIGKALLQDRECRYQRVGDILTDLKAVEHHLKSGDATNPSKKRRRKFSQLAIGTTVGVSILWLIVSGRFHSPVTAERDSVVLADFTNLTGEAAFDGSLREALAGQLKQSPVLSLISDARIKDTEQMMGQSPDAKLTLVVAKEVCQRTRALAVIDGLITKGSNGKYVLGLKAVNCRTGDTMDEEQTVVDGKEHALKAVAAAGIRLCNKLSASLSTIQRFATPASSDAMEAYNLAMMEFAIRADAVATLPFLQRAISVDPNFAMAYDNLADLYLSLGESALAAQNMRRAYELRSRAGEREKLAIEAGFYAEVLGDMDRARQISEVWVQRHPRDGPARGRASMVYNALGRYDEAANQIEAASIFDPGFGIPHYILINQYLFLNRFEEAARTAEEVQARYADSPMLCVNLYKLAFLQNDSARRSRQVAWASGKRGIEDVLLAYESDTMAYSGRLRRARQLSQAAIGSAQRAGKIETAARYGAEGGLRESLLGNSSEGVRDSQAALGMSSARDVQYAVALSLALSGVAAVRPQCEGLVRDLADRFAKDTTVQFSYLPTLSAALALRHNEAGKSTEFLRTMRPMDIATTGWHGQFVQLSLYPIYIRGQSYLEVHRGLEAAAEFQKILDHSGIVFNEPIGVLAHLGLARAYGLAGDNHRSRAQYDNFFALWKDADPDIPYPSEEPHS